MKNFKLKGIGDPVLLPDLRPASELICTVAAIREFIFGNIPALIPVTQGESLARVWVIDLISSKRCVVTCRYTNIHLFPTTDDLLRCNLRH